MKFISKDKITSPEHLEILKSEYHYNHELVEDSTGVIRWKPDDEVCKKMVGLKFNSFIKNLIEEGKDKNCEEIRKLYRDIGYSLDSYWKMFYCEKSNPISKKYIPNEK